MQVIRMNFTENHNTILVFVYIDISNQITSEMVRQTDSEFNHYKNISYGYKYSIVLRKKQNKHTANFPENVIVKEF